MVLSLPLSVHFKKNLKRYCLVELTSELECSLVKAVTFGFEILVSPINVHIHN